MIQPRMRTRDKAIELLRQEDPNTCMSRNAIDALIKSGKLPTVRIGSKVLINYDLLLEIVAAGVDDGQPDEQPGTIRKINV